ncbi:DNA polymerase III subunit delta [Fonticella tunisiensis]|uniref:DNA polymerase III subunit delta n=1 Tax=Fonticella tunisiensis TaxID=1096341 RepID=A0A4R7KDU5_9CLOT|nr:DNA polymerase III subunit delta [Fonticella tunisiensis]TDT51115.1 DNA polymerase III delta subunit [Fonticella tunisiensis]
MELKTYTEFKKIIKEKRLEGPIIIYGDENHLIDESIKIIYNIIKSFQEMNIVKLDGENITLDDIINACETLPFMEDKKIVHIRKAAFLNKAPGMTEDFVKNFSNYIKNLPDGIILLLTLQGSVDSTNAVFKVIKSTGYVIEYKPMRGEELQRWVLESFNKNGKVINKYELNYFIMEAGSSLEQLEREVEKVCAYASEEVITKQHIDEVVHKSIESNIFKMVDSISRKDADKAISILNALLFQKEEHLKILGMIIRQIRLMYLIRAYLDEKRSPSEINRDLKLNEFVLNNLIKQSKAYTVEGLKKLLSLCLETDYNLKNGTYSSDFYGLALETLIVELCK